MCIPWHLFRIILSISGWNIQKRTLATSRVPHNGDLARNPGMCPDWESNQQPFGSQASAKSTEPYQPGLNLTLFFSYKANYLGLYSLSFCSAL